MKTAIFISSSVVSVENILENFGELLGQHGASLPLRLFGSLVITGNLYYQNFSLNLIIFMLSVHILLSLGCVVPIV